MSIKDLRTVPRILSASAETWWNSSIATNVLCTRQISQNPYPIRILPS
uniref:Uncharacterized protein n=1 Tax=Acinetobacter baumannii TaxID=470 RepID=A0A0C4Y9F7_ACIBA|nr:hypothetical protein NG19_0106 [Acinetobacter baumannii]